MSPGSIKEKIEDAMAKEEIESVVIVIVALHEQQQRVSGEVKMQLERFHKDVDLSQFVDIGDASAGRLAKLANFVSEIVSSQSQALGTGVPTQTLNF